MQVKDLAKICHEANKAYCESIGDYSQTPWALTHKHIQESAIDGVRKILVDPDVTPKESHENWMEFKEKTGWKYGETKSEYLKTHPCMLPFDELPEEHQVKDSLFVSIITALAPYVEDED